MSRGSPTPRSSKVRFYPNTLKIGTDGVDCCGEIDQKRRRASSLGDLWWLWTYQGPGVANEQAM